MSPEPNHMIVFIILYLFMIFQGLYGIMLLFLILWWLNVNGCRLNPP